MKPQKICSNCKKQLPKSAFSKDKKRPDGLSYVCKECKASYLRDRYNKDPNAIKTDPTHRYHNAAAQARRRDKDFDLSLEEYITLINKSCYYCETPITKDTGIGLDRIDIKLGYTLANVLPCCSACNHGRHISFTVEEWKVAIKSILDFRRTNGKETIDSSNRSS